MYESHYFLNLNDNNSQIMKFDQIIAKPNVGEKMWLDGLLYEIVEIIHYNDCHKRNRRLEYYVKRTD